MTTDNSGLWLDQSLNNLEVAINLMEKGNWMQSCVYSQQTVEFANKAFIIKSGLKIDYIHDVQRLQRIIEQAGMYSFSKQEQREAFILTKTYISSRYPTQEAETTPFRTFCEEDAFDHLQIAIKHLNLLNKIEANFIPVEMILNNENLIQQIKNQKQDEVIPKF